MTTAKAIVLVVDDHEDHAMMLEVALSGAGFHAIVANSCAEAHRLVTAKKVDVLLTDLSLGDGDAIDLMKAIGADRPGVAIVLSGRDDPADIGRTIAAGYDAHFGKPVVISELVRAIDRVLSRTRSGIRPVSRAESVTPKKSSA